MKILFKDDHKRNNGQVMILIIIMIGGLLLGATAIAGILTVYQVRQSNDAVNSAQALFAADAALEWRLANDRRGYAEPLNIPFANGATAVSNVDILAGGSKDYTAQGFSGNTVRALETILQ